MKNKVKLKFILIAAACFALGFWLGICADKARTFAVGASCCSNLRMIDTAKEQAALHLGLKAGDIVPEDAVVAYCKGDCLPECPGGGVYSLNVIGRTPTCSLDPVHGYMHRLMTGD